LSADKLISASDYSKYLNYGAIQIILLTYLLNKTSSTVSHLVDKTCRLQTFTGGNLHHK